MISDKFGNPVFQENDIFNMFYHGHAEFLDKIFVEKTPEVEKLFQGIGIQALETKPFNHQESFDQAHQKEWFMPDEYQTMDIEGFLVYACPKENYQRLIEELQEFRSRDMLNLLRWLKYFVDTSRANNITWGVGRGSSVASYVLYLIGVHKIDPIKYNLDWREFLR